MASLNPADERRTWQYRAVLETRGNQTLLGCVLLSVIGRPAKHPPGFGPHADITRDSFLVTDYYNARGVFRPMFAIGQVVDMRDGFRKVADKLKLEDAERIEMFAEIRKWIRNDYRVKAPQLWLPR